MIKSGQSNILFKVDHVLNCYAIKVIQAGVLSKVMKKF